MPRYNRATAVRPLLLTKTVLLYIKFPNNGLMPVGRLGLTIRNGGPMAGYCSLVDFGFRPGGNGPFVVCRTIAPP